jgi:hypothetical protein
MKLLCVVAAALLAIACPVLAQDTTAAPVDTSYVEYSEPPITLPMGIGLRVPSYDRVNGVTIPWGPQLIVADDRVQLNALVRYRSNLGNWDPSLEGFLRPGDAN